MQKPHLIRFISFSILFILLLLIRAHAVFGFGQKKPDDSGNLDLRLRTSRSPASSSSTSTSTSTASHGSRRARAVAAVKGSGWNPIWGLGPVIPPAGSLQNVEVMKESDESGSGSSEDEGLEAKSRDF